MLYKAIDQYIFKPLFNLIENSPGSGVAYKFWIDAFWKFIKNIGTIFFYNRIGAIFTMFVAIWTARILGPVEYGKIGMITYIANLLMHPVILGVNTAMYKFLPDSAASEKDELMSTALFGNIILVIVFSWLYYSAEGLAETYLRIQTPIWNMGIVATIVLNFYILSESFIRGQKQYLSIARARLAGNLFFFAAFVIILYYFRNVNIQGYFYPYCASQLLFVIIAMVKSGLCLRTFPLSWPTFKKIYQFGFWNMANSLMIIILFSSDLFLINYFSPGEAVGVYNLYQGFAKGLFSVLFYEVFTVVFLPTIAHMDKYKLYRMFQRFVPMILPVIIGTVSCLIGIVVWLSGKEYGFNWIYILLVASGIGFYSVYQINNAIFTMEGNTGAKLSLIPLGIILPISLIIQYFFTKFYKITGTMAAITITNFLLMVIFQVMMYFAPVKFRQPNPDSGLNINMAFDDGGIP